ncbi:MAG: hypothetical protein PHS63_02725 [Desulfoplanes sp.]|nr:hypothetical protein [Desulfoplanes sp.]
MNLPKPHTRVITQKGEDMVKMLGGRWATVFSENETHVTVELPKVVYQDDGPYASSPGLYRVFGETVTLELDKRLIEDERAAILKKRQEAQ